MKLDVLFWKVGGLFIIYDVGSEVGNFWIFFIGFVIIIKVVYCCGCCYVWGDVVGLVRFGECSKYLNSYLLNFGLLEKRIIVCNDWRYWIVWIVMIKGFVGWVSGRDSWNEGVGRWSNNIGVKK